MEALGSIQGSKIVSASCSDPLGKQIKANYTILEDGTAVIEMAAASGLELISEEQRNPNITTTFGTGELIKDAINKGVRKFIVGIGGSATNDAGLGMLRSLGFLFLDNQNDEVTLAKNLGQIVKIDKTKSLKELKQCEFQIACDVNNPLFGTNGAAHIYARQKGADDETILHLDKQLQLFAKVVQKENADKFHDCPGSGAAGGLGFGFLVFLNAKLKPGIKIILEKLNIKTKIKDADFVITGEGKIDHQSSMGKVISGVGQLCKKEGIVCIALGGNTSEANEQIHDTGVSAYFSILDAPINLKDAMNKDVALGLIDKKTQQVFRLIKATTKT